MAAIDETTVILSATARLLPGQPRKPRALGLQASGLVQFYDEDIRFYSKEIAGAGSRTPRVKKISLMEVPDAAAGRC